MIRVTAEREWLRRWAPSPMRTNAYGRKAGFVVQDLDLVFRTYVNDGTPNANCGPIGLAAIKTQVGSVKYAENITNRMLDRLMRAGAQALNPQRPADLYRGLYVIHYEDSAPAEKCECCNGTGFHGAQIQTPTRNQLAWTVNGPGVNLQSVGPDEFLDFIVNPGRGLPLDMHPARPA